MYIYKKSSLKKFLKEKESLFHLIVRNLQRKNKSFKFAFVAYSLVYTLVHNSRSRMTGEYGTLHTGLVNCKWTAVVVAVLALWESRGGHLIVELVLSTLGCPRHFRRVHAPCAVPRLSLTNFTAASTETSFRVAKRSAYHSPLIRLHFALMRGRPIFRMSLLPFDTIDYVTAIL